LKRLKESQVKSDQTGRGKIVSSGAGGKRKSGGEKGE